MRHETQADDIQRFMERLSRAVREPGRVYFTRGVSAVLHGRREMTVDIDLRPDPEPAGFFEAIHALTEQLEINVKLAAPSDFIPRFPAGATAVSSLPGMTRSIFSTTTSTVRHCRKSSGVTIAICATCAG